MVDINVGILNFFWRNGGRYAAFFALVRHRARLHHILIELHPQVGQGVRTVVAVGNPFRPGKYVGLLVKVQLDVVVRAVLVVGVARSPCRIAVAVGRGQFLLELTELAVRQSVSRNVLGKRCRRKGQCGQGPSLIHFHSSK